MADKWGDIIAHGESGYSAVIDVNMWFGKATLDVYVLASAPVGDGLTVNLSPKRIGAGAFDYDFGALDDADNPLTKSYTNVMYDCQCLTSAVQGSCHADRLPRSPVLRPSGFHPNYFSCSCPLWGGSRDCSRGYATSRVILGCRISDGTRTRRIRSPGNCSIRRGES